MTAIVAWTDGKKNYLATDGRSMCGSTITSESFDKIVPIGNYYIAMSGLPRAQQLIRLAAERGIDEFPDSHLEIGEWIKALLDAEKWITDESDGVRVYQKFNGILVGPSGVYDIDPAFCLIESDESPHCYKRIEEVLAAHEGTIQVTEVLHPIGVAMAGAGEFDPYKD